MKICASIMLIIALGVAPLWSVFGQSQTRPASQNEQTIRINTAEVALDLVVRDKKGRLVRDLAATDVEVYEDGVRQQLESFRLIAREAKPAANAATKKEANTAAPGVAPTAMVRAATADPTVTALVFDRLRPEARMLARRAALAYAEEGIRPDDYAGVFAIDLTLRVLQPFTDNAQSVSKAIDQATNSSTSSFASNTEQVRNLSSQSAGLERAGAAAEGAAATAGGARDSGGAAAAGQAAGLAGAEMQLAQMNMRMLETFETLERNQQGYATVNALLAVANSMRSLPGRKTIIFFSEGVMIPPAVQHQFRSVVHAANRANVSIYAIDAAGLRVESGDAEAAREINALAARRTQQLARARDDANGPLMKALERNEDLLTLNPHTGLSQLAEQTGGFLIRDTNNLTAGLQRIDEDMRVHYLLTYVPKNQEYNGKFRQITVKLNKPNLDVQTRKGYYAIDPVSSAPVLDYEVPVLAALSGARHANAFALRSAGLHFPEANHLGLTPILAEAPLSAFTHTPDKDKKTWGTDFTIVALVRDESKQVVQKLSQHYPLSGSLDKLEAARKGEVLFYRAVELPPGRYTVETIAYDAPTGKASVRSVNLEVPALDEARLRLSSIVLLKRADRLTAEEQKRDHPFHFGEVLVYPNLGEPLRKSAVKQLAFFFTAWPAKGATGKLTMTLEVLQNGRTIAQSGGELPAADASGRVRHASALPLEGFQPGSYELKVTVKDGQSSVSRTTPFTVEP